MQSAKWIIDSLSKTKEAHRHASFSRCELMVRKVHLYALWHDAQFYNMKNAHIVESNHYNGSHHIIYLRLAQRKTTRKPFQVIRPYNESLVPSEVLAIEAQIAT